MKKLLLLLISMIFVLQGFSQDKLHLKNGEVHDVKIVKITDKEITYKKFAHLDGPDYIISKRDVVKIVYSNGVEENMNSSKSDESSPHTNEQILDFNRNIVGYNYFDMLFKRLSFSYEHIFGKKGQLGIELGFVGGLGANRETSAPQNTYWAIELSGHLYPLYQKRITYFLSPMFSFGEAREAIEPLGYGYPYYYYGYKYAPRYYMTGYLGHGLRINVVPNFGVMFLFGLGFRYNYVDHTTNNSATFKATVNYNF